MSGAAPLLADDQCVGPPAGGARSVVLLDTASEREWLAQFNSRMVIRIDAGKWQEADAWLKAWARSAAPRRACAEWAAHRLAMSPEAVAAVSAPLRVEFAARLAAACGSGPQENLASACDGSPASASAARLCAAVLGWEEVTLRPLGDWWAAFTQVTPVGEQPAFLLDGRDDLRAAMEAGDPLACARLPLALRAEPEAWRSFLATSRWDRCATRWRMATVIESPPLRIGLPVRDDGARSFLCAAAPDALPLLERAEALLSREKAAGAGAASPDARSAAEALLHAVLDARAFTRGRFALNVPLGFSFGLKPAEGDLAAADARLVVEIDGYFHFRDAEAFRRDRRKDALLQEHGWFVLRFLAEDAVRDLGKVVAQIESTLARRDAARRTSLPSQ